MVVPVVNRVVVDDDFEDTVVVEKKQFNTVGTQTDENEKKTVEIQTDENEKKTDEEANTVKNDHIIFTDQKRLRHNFYKVEKRHFKNLEKQFNKRING